MKEILAWDGTLWKVGDRVRLRDVNLNSCTGKIKECVSANIVIVSWDYALIKADGNEFIPNLEKY